MSAIHLIAAVADRGRRSAASLARPQKGNARGVSSGRNSNPRVSELVCASLNPVNTKETIPGYVACGLAELRQYGIPTAYQDRVEIFLEDVSVPVVGFIDWRFDDHGLIVDLKTSERLPSAISLSHARQGAVYARAYGNYGMRFAYVKPSAGKKDGRAVVVYELDRMDIERTIAIGDHKERAESS
jgi:hypothetical protein